MHVIDTFVNKVAPLIDMKFFINHLNGSVGFDFIAHHVCFIFSFPSSYPECLGNQNNNVEVSNKIPACTNTSVSTRC